VHPRGGTCGSSGHRKKATNFIGAKGTKVSPDNRHNKGTLGGQPVRVKKEGRKNTKNSFQKIIRNPTTSPGLETSIGSFVVR